MELIENNDKDIESSIDVVLDYNDQLDQIKSEDTIEEHKFNIYAARQLKNTKIVLIILFMNYILNTVLIGWLGFFDSQFFNYGPSENLVIPFTLIVIDTWSKYIMLCSVIIYNDIVTVICADLVSPWIFSHVMNGVQYHLGTPKVRTYILIQIYFTLTAFTNFGFIGVSSSQIDFYIIGHIGPLIAGLYTVWYYIKMKE